MLGAIAGDIIGSIYERHGIKTTDFPLFGPHNRFTDDTVMTIAVAYAILEQTDYATAMKQLGRNYPNAGYGDTFIKWLFETEVRPYHSWGKRFGQCASARLGGPLIRWRGCWPKPNAAPKFRTTTRKGSRVRRRQPWLSFWPVKVS